jgi:para-aminobenzoate synthetase component I
MTIGEFTRTLNEWGSQQLPFLFLVDFEMENPQVFRLDEIDPQQILYDFNGLTNAAPIPDRGGPIQLERQTVSLADYKTKFDHVLKALEYGDSYLTNLTVKTLLQGNINLKQIFFRSRAKYKLWFRDQFLVFSPEIFVQVKNNRIFSYPMKGTIDANIPKASQKIVNDPKELAEHVTIVDLIRNDLSLVSDNVTVTRFRFLEELITTDKRLLQVSSEIIGDVNERFQNKFGDLLLRVLPAGSVSGAPKHRTLEIIRCAEGEKRGYYTGVCGIFDGRDFDSGVMIRFIEQHQGQYFYRSGGGITTSSVLENEYQEVIDKVYVPID